MDDEEMARKFHNTYERLAPQFGYETREETKQFDPSSANGQLMIAVCREVGQAIRQDQMRRDDEKNSKIRDAANVALGHLTGGMDGDWRNCDPTELIRAALNGGSDGKRDHWLCHECGERVKPTAVTYDERHDGCGGECY